MEVILEAELGQSALKVICNPECDVVILNLTHVVSFFMADSFLFITASLLTLG